MKLTDFLKLRGLSGSGSSSEYLSGTGVFSTPAGGSASDMLGTLTAAEISVTTGTTATISRMHVCSGTSADYTVTLPAASGNTGKFIGFRMATGLTKLVTIDGNASETIDGSLTRVMWANEAAILLCDGSNWFKVAGKAIPMQALMRRASNQTGIVSGADTAVTLTQTDVDNTGLMCDPTTNHRITIVRGGTYFAFGNMSWDNWSTAAAARVISIIYKNGSTAIATQETNTVTGAFPTSTILSTVALAVGDLITLNGLQFSGNNQVFIGASSGTACKVGVTEVPGW